MTKHHIHGRHGHVGTTHLQHTPSKPPSLLYHILPYVIVAVLAGVPFCLGKYFELNSPEPFDGGSYLYSAKHILDGAKIGVEEIPSAHPGTLFVNMLSIKLFGYHDTSPKIMQGILQAIALIVMFLTLAKLWGKLAAGVSVVMASVYLSAPVIAKYGNVKEQFMIVFMVLGVCCFILQQLSSRWWYGLLAGAFLVWAPMFKPTAISAAAGVGLFALLQPVLKNRSWRQMGTDLGLLLGGAAIAMAPMYIWIFGWHVQMSPPYWFLVDFIAKRLPGTHAVGGGLASDYVATSHEMMPYSELVPRVFRYYWVLILPVAMALVAIGFRLVRWGLSKARTPLVSTKGYERFVLVLAVWWILDMAFIWVSAHSYEQYYLPLTASGAMLGGYVVALYHDRLKSATIKIKWYMLGALGVLVMLVLAWPILFGIKTSPYSGTVYLDENGAPSPRNGYRQKWAEVQLRRQNKIQWPWEQLSYYIRDHSEPNDTIYVWGWYPGIYVLAERVSPTPNASEGSMHTLTPEDLSKIVNEIVGSFEKRPPKFIVDSYKMHFPFNRPQLELWPSVGNGFRLLQYTGGLPADQSKLQQVFLHTYNVQATDFTKEGFLRADDPGALEHFDAAYEKKLAGKWPDEAQRFEAMKPFRDYVMKHYRLVARFGDHALFQRK
jgi:hypothetical protein